MEPQINKEASELLRKALIGLLVGGGTYGALRLAHDLPQAMQGEQRNKNELSLTLPAARLPQAAQQEKFGMDAGDFLKPVAAYGGGGLAGFLGAGALYQHLKKKQIENQTKDVEQQYLAALQQAHQKVAEVSTPHVDAFIKGLLSKVAEVNMKEASGMTTPDDIPHSDLKTVGGSAAHGAFDWLRHTPPGAGFEASLVAAGLGAAGLTYWINKQHEQQKQENKAQMALPTNIKLNVA